MVGGGFSFYNVVGDSALVPGFVEPGFDTLKSTHNLNTLNFGLAGGYAHTFVIKRNGLFPYM
ncbi:MAG TPA: hypothetical protein DDY13_06420 [Cytophagales bacterium]|nr:hypothetical protein [Cytophagales bacterium]